MVIIEHFLEITDSTFEALLGVILGFDLFLVLVELALEFLFLVILFLERLLEVLLVCVLVLQQHLLVVIQLLDVAIQHRDLLLRDLCNLIQVFRKLLVLHL